MHKGPLLLVILDGWGEKEAMENNAIAHANKPYWEQLKQNHPWTTLSGSGTDVGLPAGQMGNSEVGHLNIGAGRVVQQDYERITQAISDGSFAQNEVLSKHLDNLVQTGKHLHVMGLLSPGGVHSHEDQIFALCQLAQEKGVQHTFLHAFLDGRDTPPQSALPSLKKFDQFFKETGCGQIASLSGRYYAMDRDKRWDRIEPAYRVITQGQSEHHFKEAESALNHWYQKEVFDEFIPPSLIEGTKPSAIGEDDVVVFMNFRADRARQLTEALSSNEFAEFKASISPEQFSMITLTQYQDRLPVEVAFAPQKFDKVLGEVLADNQLKQLRIAETEKYAHVTFFFNGGIEQAFPGEERVLVPSPKVATYDLQPEMNAQMVTDKIIDALDAETFDVIIVNYANPDMVGHTGNFDATVKAIETIDSCLAQLIPKLQQKGGQALITADHGNAEQMHCHQSQQAHTAHTSEPVPLIYIGKPAQWLNKPGVLSDIAPTMLYILGINQPSEMTGQSLLEWQTE